MIQRVADDCQLQSNVHTNVPSKQLSGPKERENGSSLNSGMSMVELDPSANILDRVVLMLRSV